LSADRSGTLQGGDVITFSLTVANLGTESGVYDFSLSGPIVGELPYGVCRIDGARVGMPVSLSENDLAGGGTDEMFCQFTRRVVASDIQSGSIEMYIEALVEGDAVATSNEIDFDIAPTGSSSAVVSLTTTQNQIGVGENLRVKAVVRNTAATPFYPTGLNFDSGDFQPPVEATCFIGNQQVSWLDDRSQLAPDDGVNGSGADEWHCSFDVAITEDDLTAGSRGLTLNIMFVNGTSLDTVSGSLAEPVPVVNYSTNPEATGLFISLASNVATVELGESATITATIANTGETPMTGVTWNLRSARLGINYHPVCDEGALFPATLAADNDAPGGADEIVCTVHVSYSPNDLGASYDALYGYADSNEQPGILSEELWLDLELGDWRIDASITASPLVAQFGETVTYTLTIHNPNPFVFSNTESQPVFIDLLLRDESYAQFRCASPSGPVPVGEVVLAADNGAPGGPDQTTCTATTVVSEDDVATGYIRAAGAFYPGVFPSIGLNANVLTTPTGELSISLQPDRTVADPGETVTLTATLVNTSATLPVTVAAVYDEFYEEQLGPGGIPSCTVDGSSVTFPYEFAPNDSAAGGPDEMTCTFTHRPAALDAENGEIRHRLVADVQDVAIFSSNLVVVDVNPLLPATVTVEFSTTQSSVMVGEVLSVDLVIRNTGTNVFAPDSGFIVKPYSLERQSEECEINGVPAPFFGNGTILAPDDGVDGSGLDEWHCTYRGLVQMVDLDAGSINVFTTISSNQGDFTGTLPPVTVVPGGANLTVSTGASPLEAEPGDTVHFTYDIRNTGGLPALLWNAYGSDFGDYDATCTVNGSTVDFSELVLTPGDGTDGSGTDEVHCENDLVILASHAENFQPSIVVYAEIGQVEATFPSVHVTLPDFTLVTDVDYDDTEELEWGDTLTISVTVANTGTDPVTGYELFAFNENEGEALQPVCTGVASFPITLAAGNGSPGGPDELSCTISYVVGSIDMDYGTTYISISHKGDPLEETLIESVEAPVSSSTSSALRVDVNASPLAPQVDGTVNFTIRLYNPNEADFGFYSWSMLLFPLGIEEETGVTPDCPDMPAGGYFDFHLGPNDNAPGGDDEITCTYELEIGEDEAALQILHPQVQFHASSHSTVIAEGPAIGIGIAFFTAELSADSTDVFFGGEIQYTAVVKNVSGLSAEILSATLNSDTGAVFSCSSSLGARPFPITLSANDGNDGTGDDELICSAAGGLQIDYSPGTQFAGTLVFATGGGYEVRSNNLVFTVVEPPLEVTITANPDQTFPGGNVQFTYQVTNTSDATVSGITGKEDQERTIGTFQSFECGGQLFPADLDPGESFTCTGIMSVNPAYVVDGYYTHTATVTATSPAIEIVAEVQVPIEEE
jgi:hypothetical protein